MNRIASLMIAGFVLICLGCIPGQTQELNKEEYRPQFHFTPEAKWMNDPNGMVYYDGEYHLFFQHYPDGTTWGPMHWGHAVSKDLIHWERLPIALYPDSLGFIFSGSAVMDLNNTSGLGSKEHPAMVAIFTYHNPRTAPGQPAQSQGLAYSTDKGRTWVKYSRNPIIKNPGIPDFRDPKVSWNKQSGKWTLVLAAGDRVKFYSSPNLLDWTFESEFGVNMGAHGGVWECPDIFPMTVQGTHTTKWILIVSINPGGPNGGSATQYFVGDFDGHAFVPAQKDNQWIDYGKDNYAGVTWSNVPASDGRTLFLGWMSNWQYAERVPSERWRSANTFPRELSLLSENGHFTVVSQPIREIASIRTPFLQLEPMTVREETDLSPRIPFDKNQVELFARFVLPQGKKSAAEFGIKLANDRDEQLLIGFDAEKKELFVQRQKMWKGDFSKQFEGRFTAPCQLRNDTLELHLLIDQSSVEVFAQGGRQVMTDTFFPDKPYSRMLTFARGGEAVLAEFKICRLNAIW